MPLEFPPGCNGTPPFRDFNSELRRGTPPELRGKSMLMIGDSLDRNAMMYWSGLVGGKSKPYLEVKIPKGRSQTSYNYCRVGDLTLGQFMNYGVFEPPYWQVAYRDSKHHVVLEGLQDTAAEHIRQDATRFREAIGGLDPTIVVVSSYLWDLSRHWMVTGKAEGLRPGRDFLEQWSTRVPAQLRLVRQTFPRSRLVWRTAPPVPPRDHGRNAEIVHDMNEVARYLGRTMGFEVAEYGPMLEGRSPETERLKTSVHPEQQGSIAYVNLLLNVLAGSS